MDIAKIRKKLKEAKEGHQAEKKPAEEGKSEDKPAPIGDISPRVEEPQAEDYLPPYEQEQPETIKHPAAGPIPEERQDILQAEEIGDSSPPEHADEPEALLKAPEEKRQPVTAEEKQEDVVELLTFKLSNEDYAFKVSDVEEILRPQRVAGVPRTGDFILGITSLRGKIIPLIDLKKRFSLSGEADNARAKILILRGAKGSIGALVDRVVDVIRVQADSIVGPPSHLTESELRFIEGVAVSDNRFISIVHMEELLNFSISGGANERKA